MTTVTELHVDLGAIVRNWLSLHTTPTQTVAAVLKADAYGTGAAAVAPALHAAGCREVFVAHLDEALALRPLLPGTRLAVLNGLWPGAAPEFVAHDIRPVLGSLDEVEAWAQAARMAGRPLPALLHVDTGLNRLGLPPVELDRLVAEPERLDGIVVETVMTHLAAAEDPADGANERQRAAFHAACDRLPPPLRTGARRSLANSSGLFLGPAFQADLARPGAALFGVNPTPGRPNPMRPVVTLRARILQVRDVPAGEAVGYNGTWSAGRASRIATISVGYADGFLRSLSNRAVAHFDGAPVPLVGRVSMDLTTFDVTDAPAAQAGGWLELIGRHNQVDAVALQAGTNGYEVLTSLGRRYGRVYRAA